MKNKNLKPILGLAIFALSFASCQSEFARPVVQNQNSMVSLKFRRLATVSR